MSVFTVTLRALSPLHIGDGNELRLGFDFIIVDGSTCRLDEDAILAQKADQLQPRPGKRYPLPGELLTKAEIRRMEFFRYVLKGAPRSVKADARLKSFIKDIQDRPYIPGSSLKGALRTALAWTGWKEVNPKVEAGSFGHSKSWAGQRLERKLFGPDPNHDLLRALHVSDLFGPQKPGQGLRVVNAQVLTLREASAPVELEAITGDVAFTGSMTIDETLFSSMAEPVLHFGNRKRWLDTLLPRAQQHSQARIARLRQWFEAQPSAGKIAEFYRSLEAASLPVNQALVQIGWGSGWDGKTFWTHLQSNSQLFEGLVRQYRMSKSRSRRPGDPFPTSRRVLIHQGNPYAPFGWALLEISPL